MIICFARVAFEQGEMCLICRICGDIELRDLRLTRRTEKNICMYTYFNPLHSENQVFRILKFFDDETFFHNENSSDKYWK